MPHQKRSRRKQQARAPAESSAPLEELQRQAATQPTNLLNLPLELQCEIYKFVLQEPTLWDRHHRDGCHLRPTTPKVMAQPPFMSHRVYVEAMYDRSHHTPKRKPRRERVVDRVQRDALSAALYEPPSSFRLAKTWTWCTCGKRTGLNLLRANRHIFSVAAPIFWSKNTLSFFDVTEFSACMTATSAGTRALIRDVSIITFQLQGLLDARVCLRSRSLQGQFLPEGVLPWHQKCLTAFWPALKLLPNLTRLAIPADYLEAEYFSRFDGDELDMMRQYLGRLGEVYLTNIGLCGGVSRGIYYRELVDFWKCFFDGRLLQSLCCFTQRIHMNDWISECGSGFPNKSLFGNWNFATNVYEAIESQLMVSDTDQGGNAWRRPNDDIIGGTGTASVWLSRSKPQVTFHNMPLDKDACAKNKQAQTSRRDDEKRQGARTYRGGRRLSPARCFLDHFEHLRLDEYRYSFRDLTDDEEPKLNAPKPAKGEKVKRERVKKNRRKWKGEVWND